MLRKTQQKHLLVKSDKIKGNFVSAKIGLGKNLRLP